MLKKIVTKMLREIKAAEGADSEQHYQTSACFFHNHFARTK
jgi:hypothetical protein